VIKIQAEITRARASLLGIEGRRTSVTAELNALRDRPGDTPVLLGTLPPPAVGLPAMETMRRRSLDSRPELAEVRARADLADVQIELARKRSGPDLTVGLSYVRVGKRDDNAGRIAPPEGNGDDILGLTGGISLPIWRKPIGAGVEEAVQHRLAAEQEMRAITAGIGADLADLARRIPLLLQQTHLFDDVLAVQAEESLRSVETAYASSTVSALDLLDAERVLLAVRTSAERTRSDLAIAVAELEGVLGGPLNPNDNHGGAL
jgi:cobalt-zinc-cadmium efflux system outer membrane protein